MVNFIKQLLDWIYCRKCYICGKEARIGSACGSCIDKIEINQPEPYKKMSSCEIYSATLYKTGMRELIKGLKYHKKRDLAKPIADIMYKHWKELKINNEDFEIVPVPLYPSREKGRGYNQVSLVAEEFSKLTGYSINTRIAKRVKDTEPQYRLSKAARARNLKGAFTVNKKEYTGKKLLLLDDISTTGTTLEELKNTFECEDIPVHYAFVTANPISESPFI